MKKLFFIISCFLFISIANGQKIDSIKYDNGYLYYHEFGKGEAILLLSGGPGYSCEKELEIAKKVGKYARAIVLEQQGTGRSLPLKSDSTTINLQVYYDNITKVINHLNIKQIYIYSHSWAAITALGYASLYPKNVKSLILICPATPDFGDSAYKRTIGNNRERALGNCEKEKYHELVSKYKSQTLTKQDRFEFEKLLSHQNIFDVNQVDSLNDILMKSSFNERTNQLMNADLSKRYNTINAQIMKIKSPVYIISGRQDPIAFMTYELKQKLSQTQIYWVQDSGHYPFLEQANSFFDYLNTIINEIDGQS